jgi:hypothetical protein
LRIEALLEKRSAAWDNLLTTIGHAVAEAVESVNFLERVILLLSFSFLCN